MATRQGSQGLGRGLAFVSRRHELELLLARDLPGQFALVVTYRAEDLPPATAALGAAHRSPPGARGIVIRLSPLTRTDLADLAGAALGAQATPELCAALHRRSEGLPLVAEEDLITLRDQAHPLLRHRRQCACCSTARFQTYRACAQCLSICSACAGDRHIRKRHMLRTQPPHSPVTGTLALGQRRHRRCRSAVQRNNGECVTNVLNG